MQVSYSGKFWQIPHLVAQTNAYALVEDLAQVRSIPLTQKSLSAPSVFEQMPQAIERIYKAIHNKETVYIFGDYDCDGVTSIVQLCRYFLRYGLRPIIDVPHRVRDGYGLQPHVVERIIASKATLLITVDNGITCAKEVAMLKQAGIDTIITDHHEPPVITPEALAIIHPIKSTLGTDSPLAGAGVVHFLVRGLENDARWPGREYDEILAMVGTVGDIVSLTGENRTITQIGLTALQQKVDTPIHTLCTLLERKHNTITSTDISFGIVPPINAAGRIGEPILAVKALLGNKEALQQLVQSNIARKELTEEFLAPIASLCDSGAAQHCITYKNENIPHGIIGLLAGKITEQTGKPAVVATCHNGECTASLRSTVQYNIMDGLQACKSLLLRFGGHHQAAGFSCKEADWPAICSTLQTTIASAVSLQSLRPVLTIDAIITAEILTLYTLTELQKLEPFGQNNPEPQFLLQNIQLTDVHTLGAETNHLKAKIGYTNTIGFGLGHLKKHCNGPVNIVCALQKNYWNGKSSLQLRIIDIAPGRN